MGYRRSSDEGVGSSRWRRKHRKFLIECGVPIDIVDSDRTLNYVLLHGADELGSGWNTNSLSAIQAERLVEFLTSELKSTVGYDLVAILERGISNGTFKK